MLQFLFVRVRTGLEEFPFCVLMNNDAPETCHLKLPSSSFMRWCVRVYVRKKLKNPRILAPAPLPPLFSSWIPLGFRKLEELRPASPFSQLHVYIYNKIVQHHIVFALHVKFLFFPFLVCPFLFISFFIKYAFMKRKK